MSEEQPMTSGSKKGGRPYRGKDASERIKERRRAFLHAGIEMFGVQGYAGTGIRDVCITAGLTERYFYESFKNKEDLLSAVYRKITEEEKDAFMEILMSDGETREEKVARTLHTFFTYLRDDPRRARIQFMEVLGVGPRVDKEYLDAFDTLSGMMALLLKTIFPKADLEGASGRIIPTMLAGSVVYVAMQWVLKGYDIPIADLVEQISRIFFITGEGLTAS